MMYEVLMKITPAPGNPANPATAYSWLALPVPAAFDCLIA